VLSCDVVIIKGVCFMWNFSLPK